MEKNISILIQKIKSCNLSDEDKLILIEKLETKNPDIDDFLKTFLNLCKVSHKVIKLFDIDIWNIL
tara:strand:+ start:911 stop:1108 length:198 start_codon:yes stop_codon:yes gene_type:complete